MEGVEHDDCTATWKELALEIERLIKLNKYMSLRELAEHTLTNGGGQVNEEVQENNP